jgi:sulfide:quinone oxidoreductase
MAVRDVMIVGAGIAGIEGLLRLRRLAGDRVEITLLSPDDEFICRPLAVLEPFNRGSIRRHRLRGLIAQTGVRFVQDRLVRVDPAFRLVATGDGRELHYDALLLAPGAGQSNPHAHATLFTDRDRGQTFRSIVADLDGGRLKSLTFVVPNSPVWAIAALRTCAAYCAPGTSERCYGGSHVRHRRTATAQGVWGQRV